MNNLDKKVRESKATKIAEVVETYGMEDKSRMARALFHFCPWLTYEEREVVIRTGKPPLRMTNERPKPARTGFGVRIKGDMILVEYWEMGKRRKDMDFGIPVKKWPREPHPLSANVAYDKQEFITAHIVITYICGGVPPETIGIIRVWSGIEREAEKVVTQIDRKLPKRNAVCSDDRVRFMATRDGDDIVAAPLPPDVTHDPPA